ncbi:4-hydroxy-2-ketovalerate aldolase [Legionella lansingensis]|uniref:Homocitrate synthase n=1 Tax=Legionella lansingensis TaxID=45067 RepID=A0A0W0VIP2_9GAMM|nr:4-hydroxy-2-oxovalerate aldolase [Legionella lansingensis]KTD19955.1 4-hydroxy-2-oxovalerate aldolase [Legionella lansingensis]SNV48570.1 4-hydroxy-2-ketovalerate aldolase [Legionella lansingensis]
MTQRVEVFDVSLRDGGHRTDFNFQDEVLEQILTAVDRSGIEYIEIGYRNGPIQVIKNIGRAGLCQRDYLHFCAPLIRQAKIAVMVYPRNIAILDIKELEACGVTLLRICVPKGQLAEAAAIAAIAKQTGLKISFNFINMSQYAENELDKIIEAALQYAPDIIYLADSNGSVLPDKISSLYKKYTSQCSLPFGFHAHDNLGLAQANAIAAIHAGATYIDASLGGMGKGIGNLRTEFFAAYLQATKIKDYNLQALLSASNYVREVLKIGQEGIELDEFNRAIANDL